MNYYILRFNPFTHYASPADTYDVIPANTLIPEKYWFGGMTGSKEKCLEYLERFETPVFEACAMPLPGNSYHVKCMKQAKLWH